MGWRHASSIFSSTDKERVENKISAAEAVDVTNSVKKSYADAVIPGKKEHNTRRLFCKTSIENKMMKT